MTERVLRQRTLSVLLRNPPPPRWEASVCANNTHELGRNLHTKFISVVGEGLVPPVSAFPTDRWGAILSKAFAQVFPNVHNSNAKIGIFSAPCASFVKKYFDLEKLVSEVR